MSTFKSFLYLLLQLNSGFFKRVEVRQAMVSQSYRTCNACHFGGYRVMRDAVVGPLYDDVQYSMLVKSLFLLVIFVPFLSQRSQQHLVSFCPGWIQPNKNLEKQNVDKLGSNPGLMYSPMFQFLVSHSITHLSQLAPIQKIVEIVAILDEWKQRLFSWFYSRLK